jgi:hypothetical protein
LKIIIKKKKLNKDQLGSYDYFLMKQREEGRLRNNQPNKIKQGKGSDDPRKEKSMSIPSGVANFYYEIIPLRTGESSLGVQTLNTKIEKHKWTLTSLLI